MRTQTTRTIAGRVNANGTPAAGGGFTVYRTGAGVYYLDFGLGFRLMGIVGASISGFNFFNVDTFTTTGCRVTMTNTAATAQNDASFSFIATGAT